MGYRLTDRRDAPRVGSDHRAAAARPRRRLRRAPRAAVRCDRAVGPFVFFDHFGPVEFAPGRGMDVRPHPHIGLATVTYLFDGEIRASRQPRHRQVDPARRRQLDDGRPRHRAFRAHAARRARARADAARHPESGSRCRSTREDVEPASPTTPRRRCPRTSARRAHPRHRRHGVRRGRRCASSRRCSTSTRASTPARASMLRPSTTSARSSDRRRASRSTADRAARSAWSCSRPGTTSSSPRDAGARDDLRRRAARRRALHLVELRRSSRASASSARRRTGPRSASPRCPARRSSSRCRQ